MEHVNYISASSGISSENGSKDMWLIMDNSFVSDGWSHTWNPGRFPARPSWRIPTTATSPPNLAEVMARQTELLNQLVQAQMGQFHHQS
jgi:hypothetical protein